MRFILKVFQLKFNLKRYIILLAAVFLLANVWCAIFPLCYVRGPSMSPTVSNGEMLLSSRIFNTIERFDIVTIRMPDGQLLIKRIIGLPGETVRISGGHVYINGEKLDDVVSCETLYRGIAIEPIVLGKDEYFVLGDNRGNSMDSRNEEVGVIHLDMIESKIIEK